MQYLKIGKDIRGGPRKPQILHLFFCKPYIELRYLIYIRKNYKDPQNKKRTKIFLFILYFIDSLIAS